VADLGKGPRGPQASPLFWAKNEEIAEGRKVGRARNPPPPPPPPSSRSGSATVYSPYRGVPQPRSGTGQRVIQTSTTLKPVSVDL